MTDIPADGQPFENPVGAAAESYAMTPPSFGEGFAAMFHESSLTEPLARWLERGAAGQSGVSGYLARSMLTSSAAEGGFSPEEMGLDRYGNALPSPQVTAEQAQERFAPVGPDGKRVPLFDQPLPENLARVIGKAKEDEIAREGVLARFTAAQSGPATFATGVAATMLDPLNVATMLIPGPGEGAIAARLGTGLAARIAARGIAGAAGATLGQAPAVALRYGLGREEGSDYGLRDAFRDLLYNAAGGAILQAGFGTAAELLRGRPAPTAPAPGAGVLDYRELEGFDPAGAAELMRAPASVHWDAMRSAIGQIVDGRPVDVMPVIDEQALRELGQEATLRQRGDELAETIKGITVAPEARDAGVTLARLSEVERQLAAPGLEAAERRALLERRDELLTNTSPETLRETAAPLEIRRQVEGELANVADRLRALAAAKAARATEVALSPLPKIAEREADRYRSGWGLGLSDHDFAALDHSVYAPEAPAEPAGARPAEAPPTPGEGGGAPGAPAQAASAGTETSKLVAEAEAQLKAEGRELHPDDQAELERAEALGAQAGLHQQALQEAAACLGRSA